MPDAQRRTSRGWRPQVQPLPHDRTVRADARCVVVGSQPPLGGDGVDHRDGDVGAGEQLVAAEHQGAVGDDPEVERVLDGAVRQVPRGAGVAVVADGSVRRVAVGRRRVRDVLRVHRWREQPVGPGAVRRHDTGGAAEDPGGGLPPHRGSRRSGHRLGSSAEGVDAGQAVLRLLRPGRDARPAPCPEGVGRQVRRPVRRRLGRSTGAHVRPPARARGDPRRRRPHRPQRGDHRMGRHARRDEAGVGPRDGGVRRVPRTH